MILISFIEHFFLTKKKKILRTLTINLNIIDEKEIDFVDMLFSIGFRTSCLLFPHHPGLMSNFLFPTFKQDTKLSMSMSLLIDLFPPNYTQTIFTID